MLAATALVVVLLGLAFVTYTTHWVYAVAVTPDGRQAVSGSSDDTVRVWDLASGRQLRTLTGHTDNVNAVAVTPDGRQAVSSADDDTVRVWDLASGRLLRTLTGHTDLAFVSQATIREMWET